MHKKVSNKRVLKKLAYLEFVNDQLLAEIKYVDHLLKLVGFSDGLQTVKLAAQEILTGNEDSTKE